MLCSKVLHNNEGSLHPRHALQLTSSGLDPKGDNSKEHEPCIGPQSMKL
jgi:hypothetical protein